MTGNPFSCIGIVLAAYALSLGLAIGARTILLRRDLLDHPNERSSHKGPVPRGGGWVIMLVIIPGMILTALAQKTLPLHAGPIAGAILLALISWRDDRASAKGGTSIGLRLATHIFAACIGSLAFAPQELVFAGALPFWLDRGLMIVAWAWFANLYNFMDGIDGITGAETISIATGVCILLSAANIPDPFAGTLTLLLIGACLGFLALNWHPAKIFLGDIGSVPLGFLTGYLLLLLAVKGQWAAALILPLYYLADSGLTLVKRGLRGEKVWRAHCEHFYQRAAQGVGRHDKVVLWIVAADIALIAAAAASLRHPFIGIGMAGVIVAILLFRMHKMRNRNSR